MSSQLKRVIDSNVKKFNYSSLLLLLMTLDIFYWTRYILITTLPNLDSLHLPTHPDPHLRKLTMCESILNPLSRVPRCSLLVGPSVLRSLKGLLKGNEAKYSFTVFDARYSVMSDLV